MEESKITENELEETATEAAACGQCPDAPEIAVESAEEKSPYVPESATGAAACGQCSDAPEIAVKSAEEKSPDANQENLSDGLQTVQTGIERLERELKIIAEASVKTTGEIREVHKLYQNEFDKRLRFMQGELDKYHERDRGLVFDEILRELAGLYSDNEPFIEKIADNKGKKWISGIFFGILQILEANGVHKLKSKPGDKRNTRHSQIVKLIPVENPDLHDTVASSRSAGFYIENRSLVKERVEIYRFEGTSAGNPAEK
ncbi:MAG: hypothetical protein LBK66_11630 [Spirochaetaceae bacterium]|nr:hypothetical protein [Spirochaetaceae bacterium]